MYVKALLEVLGKGNRRRVHLFDVFDTLSLYSAKWNSIFGAQSANSVAAISAAFDKLGLLDDGVRFHVGLFNETTQAFGASQRREHRAIAVLRIDGNYYSSYEDAMYQLFDLVPVGGVVIFDDLLDHPEVKAFARDWAADYGVREEFFSAIGKGPGGTAWFRKTQQVTVDWSKKRGDGWRSQTRRFH